MTEIIIIRCDVPNNISENDKLPVIIDIHGGGWMYGDKGLNENYCRALADRGYVVFLILTTVLCLMLMLMSRLRTLCLRLNG